MCAAARLSDSRKASVQGIVVWGEDIVGKVGVDHAEGFLPLLGGNFSPENAQANGVAQLMPMEWGER